MKFKEFDTVIQEGAPKKFKEFGTLVEEKPKKFKEFGEIVKEEKPVSRGRSLVSAPVKGAIKGAREIADLFSPINVLAKEPGKRKELFERTIEQVLPTQDLPLERGLQRAGRIGISAIGGPGTALGKLGTTAAAATLGQLAEESGAPEWAQNLAELSAFISPRGAKGLLPKKSQKEAVEFLRSKGLTDQEIVPLIKSENLLNRTLSKISAKGKKAKELAANIKQKIGRNFDILKQEGEEKFLTGKNVTKFDDDLSSTLEKINPRFSRLIEKDVETLRNKGISQKNLIDFYQDINAVVGKQEGGRAVLNILKKPIMEGLEKINPQSAKDFAKLNEFYAKGHRFAKQFKPGIIEKLFSGGKTLGILGSLATLNFGFLPGLLGTHATQLVTRELLLNPRLQNLSLQMTKAASQNRFPVALKILGEFKKELAKSQPEVAEKIVLDEID